MAQFQAFRVLTASAQPEGKLFAKIPGPDGVVRNLGRIDRRIGGERFGFYWAPRAWYYRTFTYPRLCKQFPHLAPKEN